MDLVDRLRQTYFAVRSARWQGPDSLLVDEARVKATRARLALEAHIAVHDR
jgi:hypothetical protein